MTQALLSFLDQAITSWHTVALIEKALKAKGFTSLEEKDKWSLESGKRYFVKRGGSVAAFWMPEKKAVRAKLLTAHSDSPALKLKPSPLFSTENYLQIATELYGAPLLSSWLNRDLAIAGRIFAPEEKLVYLKEHPLCIPQLAIHLDREVNEKGLILNKQEHLNAILGMTQKTLEEVLGVKKILAHDLFLVSSEKASLIGFNQEMVASSRLDNQLSTWALLETISCQKAQKDCMVIAFFFDHEEIGSMTKEGASSSFPADIFYRTLDTEERQIVKAHATCLSIDAAHALNPNYAQKYDPRHSPLLGRGVVFKCHAMHKYATDAASLAPLVSLCHEHDIAHQFFASRSDTPSGSTVGPVIATKLGIPTVDIGVPLLSMHSIREVCAIKDYLELTKLLTLFVTKE
ncbi:MAG: hypothetical protein RLZZ453_1022 [Chlamydiota bacterium]|jgi:aspartyl aminopeptidase